VGARLKMIPIRHALFLEAERNWNPEAKKGVPMRTGGKLVMGVIAESKILFLKKRQRPWPRFEKGHKFDNGACGNT